MSAIDHEALTDITFTRPVSLVDQLGKCRQVVRQMDILRHIMKYDSRNRQFVINERDAMLHLPQLMGES